MPSTANWLSVWIELCPGFYAEYNVVHSTRLSNTKQYKVVHSNTQSNTKCFKQAHALEIKVSTKLEKGLKEAIELKKTVDGQTKRLDKVTQDLVQYKQIADDPDESISV